MIPRKRRTAKLSDHQKTSLRVVLQLADRAPGGGLTEARITDAVGRPQVALLVAKGLLELDSHGLWRLTKDGAKRARKIRRAWSRDGRRIAKGQTP